MARIRTIKPEFFRNENVAEMSSMSRLLFIGLWTIADRRGRLEDRPKRIKAEILPYDNYDVEKGLNELEKSGFILRYKVNVNASGRVLAPEQPINEVAIIQIIKFEEHQRITGSEAETESKYPPIEYLRKQQGNNKETTRTTGKEGKGKGNGEEDKTNAHAGKNSEPGKNLFQKKMEEFFGQQVFLEQASIGIGCEISETKSMLEAFLREQFTCDRLTGRQDHDLKHHFIRWAKIEKERKKVPLKKETSTTTTKAGKNLSDYQSSASEALKLINSSNESFSND